MRKKFERIISRDSPQDLTWSDFRRRVAQQLATFARSTFAEMMTFPATKRATYSMQGGYSLRDHFLFNSSPRRQRIVRRETSCSANVCSADRILSRVPFSHSHAVIDLRKTRQISLAIGNPRQNTDRTLVSCVARENNFPRAPRPPLLASRDHSVATITRTSIVHWRAILRESYANDTTCRS